MATATDVLNKARSQLGVHESPADSNRTPYGVWYGFNGVPWCAIFVSWCIATAGAKGYRFASVAASLSWAKRNGRHTNDFKPGYVCCKLYTATTGHTGLVEAVHSDGTVTSIEGNTSSGDDRNGGVVMRRRRSRSFWNRGCIRPEYGEPTPPPAQTGACTDPAGHPLLKVGATGRAVNHLQHLLNLWLQRRGGRLAGDGDFGPLTRSAVLDVQRVEGLDADGEVGPITWAKLHQIVDGLAV